MLAVTQRPVAVASPDLWIEALEGRIAPLHLIDADSY